MQATSSFDDPFGKVLIGELYGQAIALQYAIITVPEVCDAALVEKLSAVSRFSL